MTLATLILCGPLLLLTTGCLMMFLRDEEQSGIVLIALSMAAAVFAVPAAFLAAYLFRSCT